MRADNLIVDKSCIVATIKSLSAMHDDGKKPKLMIIGLLFDKRPCDDIKRWFELLIR